MYRTIKMTKGTIS